MEEHDPLKLTRLMIELNDLLERIAIASAMSSS